MLRATVRHIINERKISFSLNGGVVTSFGKQVKYMDTTGSMTTDQKNKHKKKTKTMKETNENFHEIIERKNVA